MKRKITLFLSLALCLIVCFGLFSSKAGAVVDNVVLSREEYDSLMKYKKLLEVEKKLKDSFYQELDEKKLIDGAISGLLKGADDTYTFYYNKEAWKKLWEDDEGKYAGVGVQVLPDWRTNAVTVVRVFKDTPAEKAGIKKGDLFYKVEDIEITPETLNDGISKMRGKPGEEVHVELVRKGDVLEFDLVKAEIHVNQVESTMLEGNIGLINVYQFAGEVAKDFNENYNSLLKQGAKGLIIDLRDNPGGWVDACESIANNFLDDKLLFYAEDKQHNRENCYTKKGANNIPINIIINENSASSSEIFAGAMKDHLRATLFGVKSFGKGIIQNVIPLSDKETGFQVTVAQYFTPGGKPVHKLGIEPHIEVKMPSELKSELFPLGDMKDPQLKAAYEDMLLRFK